MKYVYVCSPLRGNIEGNMEKAKGYCRDIIKKHPDVIPFAPHIYCTQFLDDTVTEERKKGIQIGNEILKTWCDELWVFGVRSLQDASSGMQAEIAMARDLGIPIRMGQDMLEK